MSDSPSSKAANDSHKSFDEAVALFDRLLKHTHQLVASCDNRLVVDDPYNFPHWSAMREIGRCWQQFMVAKAALEVEDGQSDAASESAEIERDIQKALDSIRLILKGILPDGIAISSENLYQFCMAFNDVFHMADDMYRMKPRPPFLNFKIAAGPSFPVICKKFSTCKLWRAQESQAEQVPCPLQPSLVSYTSSQSMPSSPSTSALKQDKSSRRDTLMSDYHHEIHQPAQDPSQESDSSQPTAKYDLKNAVPRMRQLFGDEKFMSTLPAHAKDLLTSSWQRFEDREKNQLSHYPKRKCSIKHWTTKQEALYRQSMRTLRRSQIVEVKKMQHILIPFSKAITVGSPETLQTLSFALNALALWVTTRYSSGGNCSLLISNDGRPLSYSRDTFIASWVSSRPTSLLTSTESRPRSLFSTLEETSLSSDPVTSGPNVSTWIR